MSIVLGANQYGKAETRVVRIYRDTDRHEIRDLNVSTSLRGDFADAHVRGQQAQVLPTDSQKNTCFAYAKEKGVGEIEEYALELARHFASDIESVATARVEVDEYRWERVSVAGSEHPHTFVRAGQDIRTTAVTVAGQGSAQQAWVVSGLKDLVVLKSTGSEFAGFLKDRYTTLAETSDRVLATSLTARWRYQATGPRGRRRRQGLRGSRGLTGARRTRRSGRSCWSVSRRCTAWRCSRPSGRWARPSWRRVTTWRRSGCPPRTNIISWPTSRLSGCRIRARSSTRPTGRTGCCSARRSATMPSPPDPHGSLPRRSAETAARSAERGAAFGWAAAPLT